MPASDEHVPDRSLTDAIVADAVQPKIEELAKELGLDTASTTVISVRGEDVATLGPESVRS